MGGAKKQLTSLLCFDIAWSIKDQSIPMVELPSWRLNIQKVLDSISNVDWTKAGNNRLFVIRFMEEHGHKES